MTIICLIKGCADVAITSSGKRNKILQPSLYQILADKKSLVQESMVNIPQSILKRLLNELKRLKDVETKFTEREAVMNAREWQPEPQALEHFEERSDISFENSVGENKRDFFDSPRVQDYLMERKDEIVFPGQGQGSQEFPHNDPQYEK